MANNHMLRPSSLFFVYGTLFFGLLLNLFPWGNHTWVPDWLLMGLVYWTINEPRRIGISIAFILGILMDVQTASILGTHTLIYSLVSFIAIAWHRRILDLSTIAQGFHLCTIFLIASAINFLAYYLLTGATDFSAWLIFVPALIEALFWPITKWVLSTPQRRQNQSIQL